MDVCAQREEDKKKLGEEQEEVRRIYQALQLISLVLH